jgi:hypothetical protein
MSSFSQKKARVKATRRRTKKRLLKEMGAPSSSSSSSSSSLGADGIEFASSGERKRLRLNAHQRRGKQSSSGGSDGMGGMSGRRARTMRVGDCRGAAHRCALVSGSREEQIALLRHEVGVVRRASANPRVAAKVVVFAASLKAAKLLAPLLGGKKSTSRVVVIDASMPDETDAALDGFQSGKIHTVVLADDRSLVARLYEQRESIVATFSVSPPRTTADFLGRSALAGGAARGVYGDKPASVHLMRRTRAAAKAARFMLEHLKNMGDDVIVSPDFEPFASATAHQGLKTIIQ